MALTEMPASLGVQGPGETMSRVGESAISAATVTASLRNTLSSGGCQSAGAPGGAVPSICTML